MTEQPTQESGFSSTGHIVLGLPLTLAALALASTDGARGSYVSLLAVVLGLVGVALLAIGVIAKGVSLGNRESR